MDAVDAGLQVHRVRWVHRREGERAGPAAYLRGPFGKDMFENLNDKLEPACGRQARQTDCHV